MADSTLCAVKCDLSIHNVCYASLTMNEKGNKAPNQQLVLVIKMADLLNTVWLRVTYMYLYPMNVCIISGTHESTSLNTTCTGTN